MTFKRRKLLRDLRAKVWREIRIRFFRYFSEFPFVCLVKFYLSRRFKVSIRIALGRKNFCFSNRLNFTLATISPREVIVDLFFRFCIVSWTFTYSLHITYKKFRFEIHNFHLIKWFKLNLPFEKIRNHFYLISKFIQSSFDYMIIY